MDSPPFVFGSVNLIEKENTCAYAYYAINGTMVNVVVP